MPPLPANPGPMLENMQGVMQGHKLQRRENGGLTQFVCITQVLTTNLCGHSSEALLPDKAAMRV